MTGRTRCGHGLKIVAADAGTGWLPGEYGTSQLWRSGGDRRPRPLWRLLCSEGCPPSTGGFCCSASSGAARSSSPASPFPRLQPLTLVLFRVAIAALPLHIYLAATSGLSVPRRPAVCAAQPARCSRVLNNVHALLADLRRPDATRRRPRLRAQRHYAVLDRSSSPSQLTTDEKLSLEQGVWACCSASPARR